MSTVPIRTPDDTPTDVLAAVSTGRRRRVLAALDRTSPATERELARQVAAAERRHQPATVDGEYVRAVLADLHHAHLPALAEADLVAWDREAGMVTATARQVLPPEGVETVVEMDADAWDDLFECLASERRRLVLDVLRDEGGGVPLTDLARRVARREGGDADDVLVSLHHVHLPKLAEAELVEVGSDGETVSYEGDSLLPVVDTSGLLAAESG